MQNNIAIPTVKEMNDIKNDLLSQYVRHEIEAKELVDKAFDAGYSACYKTYLAQTNTK